MFSSNNLFTSLCEKCKTPPWMDQTYQMIQYVHFFLLRASFLKSWVPLFLSALVHQLAAFSNLILLFLLTCILVILLVTSVLNFLYSRCYVFIIILLYSLFLRSTFSTYFFFHFLQLFSIILRNMVFIMHGMCTYLFKPRICSE